MRKLFMVMVTLMAACWGLSAQNRTISGTVVDAANNEPLIGATVMPVGGGQGAATDVDGNFTVSVPTSVKNVRVSYVGYKEQTLPLKQGMKVRLESSSTNLQDVVVVAYGTATKESLSGSVAVVGAKDIEDRPVTSVTAALEGNAPGVQVNNSVSYPGSSPDIRIRGFNSFTRYNSPLYVVDGAVYEGNIAEINPADVESMSVLKDAASCALYGNRGANGVILITTKRAKNIGKVDVTLSINQGIYNKALPFYDRLNADEWMETAFAGYAHGQYTSGAYDNYAAALAGSTSNFISSYLLGTNVYDRPDSEVFNNDGTLAAKMLPGYKDDLDWWNAIRQTGYRQEYNVSATGATEKFNVYSSFGYMKENGYILNTDYERFNGRVTANFNPVSYLKTGINLYGTYVNTEVAGVTEADYEDGELGLVSNPFLMINNAPIMPYYLHDAEGNVVYDEDGSPMWNTTGLCKGNNSAWMMRLNSNDNTILTLSGNVFATAVLPYGFEFSLRANMFRQKQNSKDYSNNIIGSQQGVGGLDVESYSQNSYTFMQQLQWNHDYGLHNVDVFLDHENYELSYDDRFLRMSSQMMDGMPFMSNFDSRDSHSESTMKLRTESYLGRVRYNYDQRYFVEASIRRDGTSRFAKENRWGTFWSAGASWMISKEKFMQNVDWVNYLKLRLAYGAVGNDAAAGAYAYWNRYLFTTYDQTGIAIPYTVAGDNIKWESTNTLDVALEGSLFNDRFNFSIGYYNKRNVDLLYDVRRPISAGNILTNGANITVLQNIGTMENQGWELQFGVDIIRNANLTWNFNIDASFLKNKIVHLPDGKDLPGQALFQGYSRYEQFTYTWAGVDRATGNSLYKMEPNSPDYYVYNEQTGKMEYDKSLYEAKLVNAQNSGHYFEIDGEGYTDQTQYAGRQIQGTSLPTVYGSFGTNLSWKGLNFGLLFTYSLGGKSYNGIYQSLMMLSSSSVGALHKDLLNAWTEPSGVQNPDGTWQHSIDPNGVPINDMELNSYNCTGSSRWLMSNDYLTLKNLNINYDFPKRWVNALKLQNINLGFSVDNLFILASKRGLNPQYSFGGGQGNYFMPARVYNFSLSFKF